MIELLFTPDVLPWLVAAFLIGCICTAAVMSALRLLAEERVIRQLNKGGLNANDFI